MEICLSCALRDTYGGLGAVDTDGAPSVYCDSPEVDFTAKTRYQEEISLGDVSWERQGVLAWRAVFKSANMREWGE